MADSRLEIFPNEFVANIEAVPYHAKWVRANPLDSARWAAFRDALLAGESPVPPTMTTKYGRALVAAGKDYMTVDLLLGVETPDDGVSFGTLLPARLAESSGSTTNVSTLAELQSAITNVADGDIINITGTIDGAGTTLTISRVASVNAPLTIQGGVLTGFVRVNLNAASYVRLRGIEITAFTGDGIKIDGGSSHIEIDGCHIHDGKRQGILVGSSSSGSSDDVQIWNNTIHGCGDQTRLDALDHGIYFGYTTNGVIANNLIYDNVSYNLQVYPESPGCIITCNTFDGGLTEPPLNTNVSRGGMVIGSSVTPDTGDTLNVGLIVTNAPNNQGIRINQPLAAPNNTYDALMFGNSGGDYETDANMTYTNCTHEDPLYTNRATRNYTPTSASPAKGKIQPAQYPYVPPLDHDGNPRVTADAGAFITAV